LSELLNKLYKLSFWNTAAAGVNFLSNLIIAKALGVAIFGKLIYMGSLAGLFGLILIIIPPNFSLIRYQEDDKYKYLLSAYYILGMGLLIIPVLIFQSLIELPVWLFYLFVFSTSLQGYFDISFQAENRLKGYYSMLFFQAFSKISILLLVYFAGYLNGFRELVLIIAISQLLISSIYLFRRSSIIIKSPLFFKDIFTLIWQNRYLFPTYYFNISLKKLCGNLIVILFEPLVTKDTLGIYALLIKVLQFVQGLIRTIESIFLFRKNLEKYSVDFVQNGFIVAFILQLIHIAVGMVYMRYIEGDFYFWHLFGMSFLHYPYIFFLKSRAHFIAAYKNKPINISYLIFLMPLLSVYLIKIIASSQANLTELILVFSISSTLQMAYLIFFQRFSTYEKLT